MDSDDEPAVILPIAWRANTQQHPVAYSSSPDTAVPAVSNPACSPVFDNVVEKECLKTISAVAKGPCTNGHDQIQHVSLLILEHPQSLLDFINYVFLLSIHSTLYFSNKFYVVCCNYVVLFF